MAWFSADLTCGVDATLPDFTDAVKSLMAAARRDTARSARAREEAMFADLFRGGGYGQ